MNLFDQAMSCLRQRDRLERDQIDLMCKLGQIIKHLLATKYKTLTACVSEMQEYAKQNKLRAGRNYLIGAYKLVTRLDNDQIDMLRAKAVSCSDIAAIVVMSPVRMAHFLDGIAHDTLKEAIRNKGNRDYKSDNHNIDSHNRPDTVTVSILHNGEIDEDAVINVLKNLISRLGQDRAARLFERARREVLA